MFKWFLISHEVINVVRTCAFELAKAREVCNSVQNPITSLQVFLVFCQHHAWVYYAGKLREIVVYCLNIFSDCPLYLQFFSLRAHRFYKKTGSTRSLKIISYKYQNYIPPSFVRMSVFSLLFSVVTLVTRSLRRATTLTS